MIFLTKVHLSLIFVIAAHSIDLPSPNPSIELFNLSRTPAKIPTINLTTNYDIKCDGKQFGYDLIKASCAKAWEQIPTDPRIYTYGARTKGFFERPLPYRYLSGKSNSIRFRVLGGFLSAADHLSLT